MLYLVEGFACGVHLTLEFAELGGLDEGILVESSLICMEIDRSLLFGKEICIAILEELLWLLSMIV